MIIPTNGNQDFLRFHVDLSSVHPEIGKFGRDQGALKI
jgi:hypothetical protein